MLTVAHIYEALWDTRPEGQVQPLTSVVIDSREARPGSLFVAFQGENDDGHNYVGDAFRNGAVAALVERPVDGDLPDGDRELIRVDDTLAALQQLAQFWRDRFSVQTIGITGSVGKTTTKELTYAVLQQRFRTLKSEGNYNNEIGLPLTLLNLRPQHEKVVLEMGMYDKGEIARLCELSRPEIGVVTMVGPVHMSRLGSMEAIVEAKRELVEALPAGGVAILNRDEPRVMGMAEHTQARVFTYGLDDRADLWAGDIDSMGLDGISFTLHHGRDDLHVHVPLLGRHSVHTSLRASAVGLMCGMHWSEIIAGLQDERTQLRLVAVPGPKGSLLLDDTYNASPESVIAALNLLKDLDGRRVAVLGDMLELGPAEEESHRLVGRRAMGVAHTLVTVGPRAQTIAEEALAAGMRPQRVHVLDDADAAIPFLEDFIEPDDVVLVKGSRGVELDRVVATIGRPRQRRKQR